MIRLPAKATLACAFFLTFLLLVPDAAVDGVDEKKDGGAAGESSSPRKGKGKGKRQQQEPAVEEKQPASKKLKTTTIEEIPDPILVGLF
jgi:hypothetical protein